jgi:translation initiation factor 1 (eIF-1/SUI1)
MVIHTSNPSCAGGVSRRIMVQGQPMQKVKDHIWENNLRKKELDSWLKC